MLLSNIFRVQVIGSEVSTTCQRITRKKFTQVQINLLSLAENLWRRVHFNFHCYDFYQRELYLSNKIPLQHRTWGDCSGSSFYYWTQILSRKRGLHLKVKLKWYEFIPFNIIQIFACTDVAAVDPVRLNRSWGTSF